MSGRHDRVPGRELMAELMATVFLWVKAVHVAAVISWMAGLLYLPRLFVYHCDAPAGSDQSETFKVMERKLFRGIMNPAMVAAFVLGGWMLATPGVIAWSSGWIWVKLAAVAGMVHFHHLLGRWRKDFLADRNKRPAKFFRMVNEIPAVVMLIIVVMVIVKPF